MTARHGRSTKAEAAEKVRELKSRGINPCLAVILVGENPASQVYVRGKINDCAQCGIESRSINLPADTTQDALLAEVKKLADDSAVQRHSGAAAAAAQIDEKAVIDASRPRRTWTASRPSTWAVCRSASRATCPAPRRAASA